MEKEMHSQPATTSQIENLAAAIAGDTAIVSAYLRDHDQPFPSFEPDAPIDPILHGSKAAEKARQEGITNARLLIDLLQGPQMCLRPCYNAFPLQAIYKFEIAQHVPRIGSISFAELADRTKLYEPDLRQIIRHAILFHRCFRESIKGEVAHSAASMQLATNKAVQDGVGLIFDDFYQSFARTVEALDTSRSSATGSKHPEQTGWALAHAGRSIFVTLEEDMVRAARFSGAMRFFSATVPGNNPALLLKAYPWTQLPTDAKIVDVGGADGYVSALIARAHPRFELVCQDLPHVAAMGVVPDDLEGRMIFASQDFFREQSVKGADVYVLRWILHNWSDDNVVQILRSLVPALKKGARIIISDNIAPGQNGSMPEYNERFVRELDSIMLAAFNSYERELQDWKRVVRNASPRFGEIKVNQIEGSLLAVLEVEWLGN